MSGDPIKQGLATAGFSPYAGERAQAVGPTGRAALIPMVEQPNWDPARSGGQPSSGLIVEPTEGSHTLEALAYNTREPVKGSNVSHAERQIVEWFLGEDFLWKTRVTHVHIRVAGRDICPDCLEDLKKLREAFPHLHITWEALE